MDAGDPIAFFLTWVTYGTWLPGDARGWVEYKQGWQLPSPTLEADCNARMIDRAIRLSLDQRMAVERQIQDTCCHGGWHLYGVTELRSQLSHESRSRGGHRSRKERKPEA